MPEFEIFEIGAMEILDSRGNPTVKASVGVIRGAEIFYGEAAVPSGASTGSYEAHELRDGDEKRYFGKGCLKAVDNINNIIAPALEGMDASNQRELDRKMRELDGTANKAALGANAILAVSLAVARAAAAASSQELWRYIGGISGGVKMPVPMMNILNGGAHADNSLDVQEFMVVPVGAASSSEAVRYCAEIYAKLKSILKSKGLSTAVGDEGGFAPNLRRNEDGLELLVEATRAAGLEPGKDIMYSLDAAASEWAQPDGTYRLPKSGKTMNALQLARYWKRIIDNYPILSIEDAAGEDDFELWGVLTKKFSDKILLIGDDLFVTNTERLKKGISEHAANCVLVKPNQIGTLTETLDFINMAKNEGLKVCVSHRSGETGDSFITDIAVSQNADFLKAGAPCRGERTAKYNRLIEIERRLRLG
jgi:enolase